ncbi:MAG: RNA recognition motif domain-containing protein [Bacillota bacterium]
MAKTLYVGNLPWSTTEEQLSNFFSSKTNVVSSRIITDRESGRSRGFGFVEVNDEDVERIIAEFNGKQLEGREIIVNEAKPRPGMRTDRMQ